MRSLLYSFAGLHSAAREKHTYWLIICNYKTNDCRLERSRIGGIIFADQDCTIAHPVAHNGRIMGCVLDLCGLMGNGEKCPKIGTFPDI